jgi:hypothetical protein
MAQVRSHRSGRLGASSHRRISNPRPRPSKALTVSPPLAKLPPIKSAQIGALVHIVVSIHVVYTVSSSTASRAVTGMNEASATTISRSLVFQVVRHMFHSYGLPLNGFEESRRAEQRADDRDWARARSEDQAQHRTQGEYEPPRLARLESAASALAGRRRRGGATTGCTARCLHRLSVCVAVFTRSRARGGGH